MINHSESVLALKIMELIENYNNSQTSAKRSMVLISDALCEFFMDEIIETLQKIEKNKKDKVNDDGKSC